LSALRQAVLEALAGVRPAGGGFLERALGPLGLGAGMRVAVLGSAAVARLAGERVGGSGQVALLDAPGASLGFPEGSFDRACAVLSLHREPHPRRSALLTELRRVVRPGVAVLVLDFRCPARRPAARAMKRFGVLFPDREAFTTLFRPGGLASESRDAGFAIRHRHPLGPFGLFEALVLEKLDRSAPR
jgi:SAM-dependent methyltransferase